MRSLVAAANLFAAIVFAHTALGDELCLTTSQSGRNSTFDTGDLNVVDFVTMPGFSYSGSPTDIQLVTVGCPAGWNVLVAEIHHSSSIHCG